MDAQLQQLESAIRCAFDVTLPKEKQLEFHQAANNLTSNSSALQLCYTLFTTSIDLNIRFWCIQRLSDLIANNYNQFDQTSMASLRTGVLEIIRNMKTNEEFAIKNKVAQLLSNLLRREYPSTWPTAMRDILELLSRGESVQGEMLARIFLQINDLIVEVDALTPSSVVTTSRNFKESLKNDCLPMIIQTFYRLLSFSFPHDLSLSNSVLITLHQFAHWADISFFINAASLELLYRIIDPPPLPQHPASSLDHPVPEHIRGVTTRIIYQNDLPIPKPKSINKSDAIFSVEALLNANENGILPPRPDSIHYSQFITSQGLISADTSSNTLFAHQTTCANVCMRSPEREKLRLLALKLLATLLNRNTTPILKMQMLGLLSPLSLISRFPTEEDDSDEKKEGSRAGDAASQQGGGGSIDSVALFRSERNATYCSDDSVCIAVAQLLDEVGLQIMKSHRSLCQSLMQLKASSEAKTQKQQSIQMDDAASKSASPSSSSAVSSSATSVPSDSSASTEQPVSADKLQVLCDACLVQLCEWFQMFLFWSLSNNDYVSEALFPSMRLFSIFLRDTKTNWLLNRVLSSVSSGSAISSTSFPSSASSSSSSSVSASASSYHSALKSSSSRNQRHQSKQPLKVTLSTLQLALPLSQTAPSAAPSSPSLPSPPPLLLSLHSLIPSVLSAIACKLAFPPSIASLPFCSAPTDDLASDGVPVSLSSSTIRLPSSVSFASEMPSSYGRAKRDAKQLLLSNGFLSGEEKKEDKNECDCCDDAGDSGAADYGAFVDFRIELGKMWRNFGKLDGAAMRETIDTRLKQSVALMEATLAEHKEKHSVFIQLQQQQQHTNAEQPVAVSSFPSPSPSHSPSPSSSSSSSSSCSITSIAYHAFVCECAASLPAVELPLELLLHSLELFEVSEQLSPSSPLADFLRRIVATPYSLHPSRVVGWQFFDIVGRSIKLFKNYPDMIPSVLNVFLSERGIFNARRSIAARASHEFGRFVRALTPTYSSHHSSHSSATFTTLPQSASTSASASSDTRSLSPSPSAHISPSPGQQATSIFSTFPGSSSSSSPSSTSATSSTSSSILSPHETLILQSLMKYVDDCHPTTTAEYNIICDIYAAVGRLMLSPTLNEELKVQCLRHLVALPVNVINQHLLQIGLADSAIFTPPPVAASSSLITSTNSASFTTPSSSLSSLSFSSSSPSPLPFASIAPPRTNQMTENESLTLFCVTALSSITKELNLSPTPAMCETCIPAAQAIVKVAAITRSAELKRQCLFYLRHMRDLIRGEAPNALSAALPHFLGEEDDIQTVASALLLLGNYIRVLKEAMLGCLSSVYLFILRRVMPVLCESSASSSSPSASLFSATTPASEAEREKTTLLSAFVHLLSTIGEVPPLLGVLVQESHASFLLPTLSVLIGAVSHLPQPDDRANLIAFFTAITREWAALNGFCDYICSTLHPAVVSALRSPPSKATDPNFKLLCTSAATFHITAAQKIPMFKNYIQTQFIPSLNLNESQASMLLSATEKTNFDIVGLLYISLLPP